MSTALEELADAAEESARDQRAVAHAARELDRQRRVGAPWSAIAASSVARRLFDRLAQSAQRMAGITSKVRHTMIESLRDEGMSTRQIAKLMGVTHQRISAMRNHRARDDR